MPLPLILPLVGTGVGFLIKAIIDEEEMRIKDEQLAKNSLEIESVKKIVAEHMEHTKYIIALSVLGAAMANADGKVSKEEVIAIREFVNGAADGRLPEHVIKEISKILYNPPTLDEAIKIWNECFTDLKELKKEISKAESLLISVMEADGEPHDREIAFLQAFKIKMQENYIERLENGR